MILGAFGDPAAVGGPEMLAMDTDTETASRTDGEDQPESPGLLRPDKSLYLKISSDDGLGQVIRRMSLVSVLCAAAYGSCMGIYHSPSQALSSAVKMPILLFLTLAITLPALHCFQLFLGGKFRVRQTIAMALIGTSAMSILMASLIPIAVFFMLASSNYAFLLLLHVALLAVAGACGLIAINRCRSSAAGEEVASVVRESGGWVITAWMVMYMFVGTQLAYMLAPFLGVREQPFEILGSNPDNFYIHVHQCLFNFLKSGS